MDSGTMTSVSLGSQVYQVPLDKQFSVFITETNSEDSSLDFGFTEIFDVLLNSTDGSCLFGEGTHPLLARSPKFNTY